MQNFEAQLIASNKPPQPEHVRTWQQGRYIAIKQIGSGTYGKVFAAKDSRNDKKIALKECEIQFHHQETKRLYRELWVLRHTKHENIVRLHDAFLFMSIRKNRRVTLAGLVFEKMDTDLHKVIKSKNTLSDEHIGWILYQILHGCAFLHSVGIIHRDLKPQNILMNSNCDAKICDFGLSRVHGATGATEEDSKMTLAVVTRFYRAPEIMLGWKYGVASDMWSVGCIFGELLLRARPLFPGSDVFTQIRVCLECLGKTDEYRSKTRIDWQKQFEAVPETPICSVVQAFRMLNVRPQALNLLEKMIQWPETRISAAEAMRHEFLSGCYDIEDEINAAPIEDPDLESLFWNGMSGEDMLKLLKNEVAKHTQI